MLMCAVVKRRYPSKMEQSIFQKNPCDLTATIRILHARLSVPIFYMSSQLRIFTRNIYVQKWGNPRVINLVQQALKISYGINYSCQADQGNAYIQQYIRPVRQRLSQNSHLRYFLIMSHLTYNRLLFFFCAQSYTYLMF